MKTMIVLDNNNKKLHIGSRQECRQFCKDKKLKRGKYRIIAYQKYLETITTAAPIESQPTGFFKRIFTK